MMPLSARSSASEDEEDGLPLLSRSGNTSRAAVASSGVCGRDAKQLTEVVNKLYSVLLRLDDPAFVEFVKLFGKWWTAGWDEPEDVFKPLKTDSF